MPDVSGAARPIPVDLLVSNATLLADGDAASGAPKAIAVANGRIEAVGPQRDITSRYSGRECFDAAGGIVHAGFIEAHLHLASTAFHGLHFDALSDAGAQGYSAIKASTTPEAEGAFAAAAAVALLRKGFTLFVEPGTAFDTDQVAAAVSRVGLRALLTAAYGWDDMAILQNQAPGLVGPAVLRRAPANTQRVISAIEHELSRNKQPETLVRGFVGLYGEGSGSDELIKEAKALARRHGTVFQQHQSYLAATYAAEATRHGCSPIKRLDRLGVLDEHTTLIHLNVATPAEIDLVCRRNANVVWCPLNSLHRGLHRDDPCYHTLLFRRGTAVGLGVDTTLTFPLGSAGFAATLLSGSAGEALTPAETVLMQTGLAARTVGLEEEVGTIAPGMRADIVVRTPGDITQMPIGSPSHLLGASSATLPVDTVFVGGRQVMRAGRPCLVDEAEILASADRHRRQVLSDAGFAVGSALADGVPPG